MATSTQPLDNRHALRVRLTLTARARIIPTFQLYVSHQSERGIAVLDVSNSGLSFATNDKFKCDDVVEIEAVFHDRPVVFHGTVRRVENGRSSSVDTVGVHFITTPSTQSALRELALWLEALTADLVPL